MVHLLRLDSNLLLLVNLYLIDLVLQALNHLVASDFFIGQLFKQSFVDTLKWLLNLQKHRLNNLFQLGHNLFLHAISEFCLNDLADVFSRSFPASLAEFCFQLWYQNLTNLTIQQFSLGLDQWRDRLLHLLLNKFGEGTADCLSDCYLNLYLEVLLRLD